MVLKFFQSPLERGAIEGDSPVGKIDGVVIRCSRVALVG